jgi:signal transduction histidine kinase
MIGIPGPARLSRRCVDRVRACVEDGRAVRSSRRELIVGIGAAVAVGAVSVLVPVSAASSATVVLETAARVVAVGLPVAVGLMAWRRAPFERFGRLLVATGAGVLAVTLSLSDDAVLYSAGRVANWGLEAGLVYVILAFPSGGLAQRVDQALVAAAVLLVGLLFLPTALLVESYPTPAPWVSCSSDCPRNAFMAVAHEPRVVDQLVSPAQVLVAIGLVVAILVRLADRVRGATRLGRRTLTPVLVVAMGWALVVGVALAVRLAWPGSALVEGVVWLVALSAPAMAVAFLIGLMRWWVYVGASLRRLAARLRSPLAAQELRSALADAFEDPSLEVVHRRAGGWVDDEGRVLAPPAPGSGRCLTEVGNGHRIVGGLIHDAALQHERAFSDAAVSATALTLESHRLAADTDLLLREVHDSRARIAASADDERRRIERNIHAGAQQRLLSLRIRVDLAGRPGQDPAAAAIALRELAGEVDAAIAEVGSLARSTYPYVLTDQGLAAALALAAGDAPVCTTVVAESQRRYAAEIENAVYFCCLEAVHNAATHAGDAAAVHITVAERDDSVCFDVRDDGAGFDPDAAPAGAGLTNIRDRVAAVGGRITIESTPGRGTRISAAIPLTPTHATDREA